MIFIILSVLYIYLLHLVKHHKNTWIHSCKMSMLQIKLKPLRPTPHSLPVSSQQGLILNSVCPSRIFPPHLHTYFLFSILALKTLKILFVFTLKILIRFFFWCLELRSSPYYLLLYLFSPIPCHLLYCYPSGFYSSWFQLFRLNYLLLFSHRLFETPWTAASQASLSFTISQSLLKLMSIDSAINFTNFFVHYCYLPIVLDLTLFYFAAMRVLVILPGRICVW